MKKILKMIFYSFTGVLFGAVGFTAAPYAAAAKNTKITGLKVNQLTEPLGIDDIPVFSWLVEGYGVGGAQTAYQIFVATTAAKAAAGTGDVWDSGKVLSAANYDIAYGGSPLKSKTDYYWAVKVWDENGELIGISDAVFFRTGIYTNDEWEGKWIGYPQSDIKPVTLEGANWLWVGKEDTSSAVGYDGGTQYFRKLFTLDSTDSVVSAGLAWTADDYSTMYFNGVELGSTHSWGYGGMADVTKLLRSGDNCIAMSATNAGAGNAGAIARLVIEYSDGSIADYPSDRSWLGCTNEAEGWNQIGRNAGQWVRPAQQVPYGNAPWNTNVSINDICNSSRAAVNLRREFEVEKQVESAYAYICGLGFFTPTVNGSEVTDSVLNPSPHQYDRTSLYCVYDVTDLLKNGVNAVGVELGNSFFNEIGGVWNWPGAAWRDNPKCRLDLEIVYTDGSKEIIATDDSWKVSRDGPFTDNSLYYGDHYDALRQLKDENGLSFDTAGYDDSDWAEAFVMKAPAFCKTGEEAVLRWQQEEPCKRTATFKPKHIQKLGHGSWVVTCPVMTTGWARLTGINAPAGQEIVITYSEKQHADGTVMKTGGLDGEGDNWYPEANICQDHYISDGTADARFEPRYSYKGFEYIQIDGWSGELTDDNIEIYLINNAMEQSGHFETSSKMVNALQQMMVNSILNNYQGRPTDTPVYEKNGWTGDANVTLDTVMYNFAAQNVMENFINMLSDTQDSFGNVADIVPSANSFTDNHPTWNTVFLFGATKMAQYYGNYSYIEDMYEAFKAFAMTDIDIIKNEGWLWNSGSYGDWCSPGSYGDPDAACNAIPSEGSKITDNATLYGAIKELAEATETLREKAAAAGDTEKAEAYAADLAVYNNALEKMYAAYNQKFYNPQKGYYETGEWSQFLDRTEYRQTSQAASLAYGLVPDEVAQNVADSLAADVIAKDHHLDTGVIGTKTLLPMLSKYGYRDLAFRIATQTTYPSWGYWLSKGATACWEQWENGTRSLDHYMFASLGEWFYSGIAGICDIENGYESFSVKPSFEGNLNYANCSIETVRGRLASNWSLNDDGTITMEITVPYGSSAKIHLPTAGRNGGVTVGGLRPDAADGVIETEIIDGRLCLNVASGSYTIITECELVKLYRFALADGIKSAENLADYTYSENIRERLDTALESARKLYSAADSKVTQKQLNDAESELADAVALAQDAQVRR